MSEENEEVSVEDVMQELNKLKANNEQLIAEKRRMSEKMNSMEEGKKQLLDKMKTAEEKRLIEAGDFDSLVQMKSQQALQAKDDALRNTEKQLDELKRQNETMYIGSLARDAASQSGVRPEAAEEVQLIVRERFRLVDGKLIGFDINGNELLNDKGSQMSINEYIQSLAPTKSYLFSPTQGAGAHGANGGASYSGQKRSEMTTEQKSAAVKRLGQEGYLNIPY